ncbi:hypothetical protein SLEP1_g24602 [Rubroshorea leprosula]|uniref:Uncharacterized protein n=1 Tax=Rubroshorea leprosula TaxID=152421 RepID=A0AAV5JLH9_9ROSI|nr:hypothetical protein SLEP1_g24602 [Rubroshorea leprosula]
MVLYKPSHLLQIVQGDKLLESLFQSLVPPAKSEKE